MIFPSRDVEAVGFGNALLFDVRNGYPYGTAQAIAERSGLSTAFSTSSRERELQTAAEQKAVENLTGEVRKMFADLAIETAALDRKAAASSAPGP